MVEFDDTSRRTVLKSGLGTIGAIGTGMFSTNSVTAQKIISQSDGVGKPEVESRVNEEFMKKQLEMRYGETVAEQMIDIRNRYKSAVETGVLTEEAAYSELINTYIDELPYTVAQNFKKIKKNDPQTGLQSQTQYDLANGELHPEDNRVQKITSDDTLSEFVFNEGNTGGSGFPRGSNAYEYQNRITAWCEAVFVGWATAWAELETNLWIEEGGSWDIVWKGFENGLVFGGDCDYQIWIQEQGNSYKNFETVKSPGGGVHGDFERSRQYNFDSDTVYNVGFRLYTSTSGIAKALVDFQTINADGSTRGIKNIEGFVSSGAYD